MERLGDVVDTGRAQPAPTVGGSAAAAAAVIVVVGVLAVSSDQFGADRSSSLGVILGLALIALGYGAMVWVDGAVRAAGVSFVLLGIPIFVGFSLEEQADRAWPILLAAAVLWGTAYVAPISRGQLPLLIGALGATWALALDRIAAAANDDAAFSVSSPFDIPTGNDATEYASLVLGVLMLLIALRLDRAGLVGIATGFIAVGNIAFVSGAFGVLATFQSATAGSLFVIAAGLAITTVGAKSERRFTARLGAVAMTVGLLLLITDQSDASSHPRGFGIAAIVVGLVGIGAIARYTESPPPISGHIPARQPNADSDNKSD